ncbi:MAG: hypothetical protein ACRC7S_08960 [Cetobacterium sp.]
MDLVKDGLFEREYYYSRTDGKVSFYKYIWSSNIEKYVPFDHYVFSPQTDIPEFEEIKRKQGFVSVEEAKRKGALRQ